MASSIMVSAQPNIENNFDTTTDSIDAIFANANRIEETTEGTLYYFDELEGMRNTLIYYPNTDKITIQRDTICSKIHNTYDFSI